MSSGCYARAVVSDEWPAMSEEPRERTRRRLARSDRIDGRHDARGRRSNPGRARPLARRDGHPERRPPSAARRGNADDPGGGVADADSRGRVDRRVPGRLRRPAGTVVDPGRDGRVDYGARRCRHARRRLPRRTVPAGRCVHRSERDEHHRATNRGPRCCRSRCRPAALRRTGTPGLRPLGRLRPYARRNQLSRSARATRSPPGRAGSTADSCPRTGAHITDEARRRGLAGGLRPRRCHRPRT